MANVWNLLSLDGFVAVVTGGGGNFGRQIVEALAEAGATTFVASRNTTALERFAAEQRAEGRDVRSLYLDLGNESSILELRDNVMQQTGKIDILVNNAVARVMSGWDDDARNFDESMHINATGTFLITRSIGEVMIPKRQGSIVNIASMMGMVGLEQHNYDGTDMGGWPGDYFFHKGGMINFTRFCASYFGRYDIRVNCISPGGLKSESHPEQFVRNYSDRTQLGRLCGDDDLKGLVVLLASHAGSYITGANIPVDGGYTAK